MTCTDTLTAKAAAPAAPFTQGQQTLSRVLRSVVETAQTWQRRRHGRAQLSSMPEYLLRDIGLDIAAARREEGKPFWRA